MLLASLLNLPFMGLRLPEEEGPAMEVEHLPATFAFFTY
jgi:hypothetical protein